MKQGGFTLIELMVVISIITIITTIVVFQQRDANDQFQLDNAANKVIFEIRKAQTYALGVQRFEGVDEDEQFDVGYGVSFRTNRDYVTFFADRPGGTLNRYDISDEIISKVTLPEGITVARIQSDRTGTSEGSIVYRRPEPQANIVVQRFVNSAEIDLKSRSGRRITIVVNKTGGVSIER